MPDRTPAIPSGTPPTLTAVSLFAGVGGIDLALERAGVHVTAAVEINPAARGVIAQQRPDIALFNDVTKVTPDELRATGFVPERGILAGGFPCQDLSVAGRRAGLGGARSGLFWHIMRLADALRPRWLLLENVLGLLSSNDGADMGTVVGAVVERGYGLAYRVLDAQFFGVPQRRRRVFFVGHLGDAWRPVQVLLEPEGGGGNPAAGHAEGARVAATLTSGTSSPGVSAPGRRQEDEVNLVVADVRNGTIDTDVSMTLQGGGSGRRGWDLNSSPVLIAPTLLAGTNETGGVWPPGTTVDTAESLIVANCLTAREAKGPDSDATTTLIVSALTANGVGTCGADDNQGQAGHLIVQPLAVRGRDEGAQLEVGPEGGPYNALRAGDGGSSRQSLVAITVTGDRAHALTSEGSDASEDGTGRGAPIIAFSHTAGIDQQASETVTPTMKAGHDSMPAVYQQQGSNVGPMGTLRAGNGNEQGGVPFLEHETTVRRLTPRECERLQGFPDDWTAVSNGKQQADSPRYQQMGNAVAVPVVEWIARRIVAVS